MPAATARTQPAAPKTEEVFCSRLPLGSQDEEREVKKGEMEANDAAAVDARLKSLGLTPSKVRKKTFLDAGITIPGTGGVGGKTCSSSCVSSRR
jgi:type IV pilus assembly protein PilC